MFPIFVAVSNHLLNGPTIVPEVQFKSALEPTPKASIFIELVEILPEVIVNEPVTSIGVSNEIPDDELLTVKLENDIVPIPEIN